jgi:hypothetical protein
MPLECLGDSDPRVRIAFETSHPADLELEPIRQLENRQALPTAAFE